MNANELIKALQHKINMKITKYALQPYHCGV